MYNGVINIYKEAGYTSHDVVNRLRRILGQKKIGHTGTLDPAATGVLPVCLGSATRLCEMLSGHDKAYEAVMILGVSTDTQDMTGSVTRTCSVLPAEERVREVICSFTGAYDQLPPMYSAVQVDGRRLYDLARKGIEVDRPTRRVTISQLQILAMDLPRVRLLVECSRGTYIRTLCSDIGDRLGCGGCIETLTRIRSGSFTAAEALTLARVEQTVADGTFTEYMIPVDAMFPGAGRAFVDRERDVHLHNGNPFRPDELILAEGERFQKEMRLYDSDGIFVGMYASRYPGGIYRPQKMFPQPER